MVISKQPYQSTSAVATRRTGVLQIQPPAPAAAGFLRLVQILAPHGPIPISKSSWWAGVKSGRYPQPVKLGPRTTAWRAADIAQLIVELSGGEE